MGGLRVKQFSDIWEQTNYTSTDTLSSEDAWTVITNLGATGAASTRPLTLPTAQAGLYFVFNVIEDTLLRITAATGDTIRVNDQVSDTASWIEPTEQCVVICRALDNTQWLAYSDGAVKVNTAGGEVIVGTTPDSHASTHTNGTDDVADMTGDAGAGGTHGLVPAPGVGDASKFLKGDATWDTAGGGVSTLDGAYDGGKTITVDEGPVALTQDKIAETGGT